MAKTSLGLVNNSNNGTPNSAVGYVYWPAFSVIWGGHTYTVNAGATNHRYIWWNYNGGSPSSTLSVSDSFPSLTADDWLLVVNTYGLGVDLTINNTAIFAQAIIPGTIQAGALAAGSVVSANIQAGTITGDNIAANTISAKNLTLTDPTNYCSNPNVANGALDWNWLGSSGMNQVYAALNLLDYTPKTWAEWTKSSGVTVDSSGITLTADGSTGKYAYCPTTFKVSSKYGVLYKIVSSTFTGNLAFRSYPDTTALNAIEPKAVGNNKFIFTTGSTVTATSLGFYDGASEGSGHSIKLVDIRMFELPSGSQIESDFNNLTADQLALIYPWVPNNALTTTVGQLTSTDNYCASYITVTPGDQFYFEFSGCTPDSNMDLILGMVFFDLKVNYISKIAGAQLAPTKRWTNVPWTTTISSPALKGATTLTVANVADILPLTKSEVNGYRAYGTIIQIGSESSTVIAVNGNVITLETPLANAYSSGTTITLTTVASGYLIVPDNAAYACVLANVSGTPVGNWYLTNINVMKMYGGKLLVDGSITADKIAAQTITADKLAAGTITADSACISSLKANWITSGTMTANKIKGGSLTLGGSADVDGTLILNDASGNNVITLDNTGETIYDGALKVISSTGSTAFEVDNDGSIHNEWGVRTTVKAGTNTKAANGTILADDSCDTILSAYGLLHSGGNSHLAMYMLSDTPMFLVTLDDANWQSLMAGDIQGSRLRNRYTNSPDGIGVNITENTVDSHSNNGVLYFNYYSGSGGVKVCNGNSQGSYGNMTCASVTCTSSKPALVTTDDYDETYMFSEEAPTPQFTDRGHGIIGNDGKCYITMDDQFIETVTTNNSDYFIQVTGETGCNAEIQDKQSGYFIVTGTVGKKFDWQVTADRKGFERLRFNEAFLNI